MHHRVAAAGKFASHPLLAEVLLQHLIQRGSCILEQVIVQDNRPHFIFRHFRQFSHDVPSKPSDYNYHLGLAAHTRRQGVSTLPLIRAPVSDDVTPWVGLPSGDKSRKREARRRPLERLAGETCRRLASLALQRGHAGWSLWPRGVPLPGSTCAGNCPARSEEHTSELQSLMRN